MMDTTARSAKAQVSGGTRTRRRAALAGLEPHPVDVPPGYPRALERKLWLSDGRQVFVRPILPSDRQALAEAIRTADADTLRRRFLGATPKVTPQLLTRLTTVDYVHRFALVAGDPHTGRGTAIARYEPVAETVAEVAVAVDPAWRRVGLATVLVEMLAEAAVNRGVHTFSALYLAENRPVAALADLAGEAGQRLIHQGIAEVAVALDRDQVAAVIRDRPHREPTLPKPMRRRDAVPVDALGVQNGGCFSGRRNSDPGLLRSREVGV
jgi:GNAT superfamily N-acetyltransferase